MSPSPLNSAQYVNQIREILVGKDLRQVHGRIDQLEGALQRGQSSPANPELQKLQENYSRLLSDYQSLREEVTALKSSPSNESLENSTDKLLAAIDARSRDILSHVQNELLQWKSEIERDLSQIRETKADRAEVTGRFSRLAEAALDKDQEATIVTEEGFLP